jgi:hypothetical protein
MSHHMSTANSPYDMSKAQESIDNPNIQRCSSSSLLDDEHTIQDSSMSHSDHMDDGTSPFSTASTLQNTTNSSLDSENDKVAYNGPSTIHVVMLRVSNESSARPMPQAAFFNRDKALAFSTRILLQWCDAHYDDYIWKGPESLRSGLMERYAAYHAQSGQQLAVADVIKVSIFDAKETEAVANGKSGGEENGKEGDDEQQHKEQFGEGPREKEEEEEYLEKADAKQDTGKLFAAANAPRPKD